MPPERRKAIAKEMFDEGYTIAAIAETMQVNRRTIERWANEGAWREQRDVVPITEGIKHKAEKLEKIGIPPSVVPVEARIKRKREPIDEMGLLEGAIANVGTILDGSAGDVDVRSLGSLATALVRLLEYRRKVQPPTVAELAEQAIALGLPPHEFVAELKRQWQLRA